MKINTSFTLKTNQHNLVFIWWHVYITSKMLWDKIPVAFELLFVGMTAWYAFRRIYRQIATGKSTWFTGAIMVVWIYVIINSLFQNTVKVTIRSIYEYCYYPLIAIAIMEIYPYVDISKCFKSVSAWGLIISILSWVEYLSRHYLVTDLAGHGVILHVGAYGFRAAVFSRSFLSHGMVLGAFSIISIYLWYIEGKKFWLGIGLFDFISILTTGSRGPLVSYAAALAVMFCLDAFMVSRKKWKKYFVFVMALLAFAGIVAVFSIDVGTPDSTIKYFIYRIQNIINWTGDAGNVGRLLLWKNAVEDWFLKSPVFGIGPCKTGSWGEGSLGVTESGVLKRFCELGVVGALLIYIPILKVGIDALRRSRYMNATDRKTLNMWLAIFVACFIDDIVLQSTEEIMVAFWYWGSLGAVYYLETVKTRNRGNV